MSRAYSTPSATSTNAPLTTFLVGTAAPVLWPGNVRELRNALERTAILCEGGLIRPEHLALEATGKPPAAVSTDLGTIERETIAQVLRECRWNRTRAAKRLGLTRTQLYLRLQKYGLEKPADA